MAAYYNDNDPKIAAWLRELISAGLIAPGVVDDRDIRDVRPDELAGYTQCHFFAGIGIWSYALRLAGWPDDRPVWTGSCPCQPFSAAGRRAGLDDERHLWPAWFYLIRQRRPVPIFGEQVASADGLAWVDVIRADLEGEAYAVGCADLCAAGFGAPHIRQRVFFVADTVRDGVGQHARQLPSDEAEHEVGAAHSDHASVARGAAGGMADDEREGRDEFGPTRLHERRPRACGDETATREPDRARRDDAARCGTAGVVVDAAESRPSISFDHQDAGGTLGQERRAARIPGVTRGFWADAEWIWCRDEKWRAVRPGSFPLAHGAPARVVRLRGYGNAINAEVAAGFIRAYDESVRQ